MIFRTWMSLCCLASVHNSARSAFEGNWSLYLSASLTIHFSSMSIKDNRGNFASGTKHCRSQLQNLAPGYDTILSQTNFHTLPRSWSHDSLLQTLKLRSHHPHAFCLLLRLWGIFFLYFDPFSHFSLRCSWCFKYPQCIFDRSLRCNCVSDDPSLSLATFFFRFTNCTEIFQGSIGILDRLQINPFLF